MIEAGPCDPNRQNTVLVRFFRPSTAVHHPHKVRFDPRHSSEREMVTSESIETILANTLRLWYKSQLADILLVLNSIVCYFVAERLVHDNAIFVILRQNVVPVLRPNSQVLLQVRLNSPLLSVRDVSTGHTRLLTVVADRPRRCIYIGRTRLRLHKHFVITKPHPRHCHFRFHTARKSRRKTITY